MDQLIDEKFILMTIVNKNISDNKPPKIQSTNMTSLGNYGKSYCDAKSQNYAFVSHISLKFSGEKVHIASDKM
ncbi:CLUMA_CG005227, isoform A [Clunio marinus]|uniref:CLUMA_CG005227, isoform A n=1 Tax=Clunio marinus TaxID=568069 RepID=A0A1J1HU94_9DIPT|nr:CLUMA_CG005227, isoform A [Clunio marinus]